MEETGEQRPSLSLLCKQDTRSPYRSLSHSTPATNHTNTCRRARTHVNTYAPRAPAAEEKSGTQLPPKSGLRSRSSPSLSYAASWPSSVNPSQASVAPGESGSGPELSSRASETS